VAHTNPTLVQQEVDRGPQVPAFPVVVVEEARQDRLRLLLARQEQMVVLVATVQQPGEDSARLAEEEAQEIPAVVLEGTPMDKAE
jgi:precorrin-6B methylase 1